MTVSELKDKCVYPWEPVLLDIENASYAVVAIHDNTVYVGNSQEPMFGQEILDELDGKFGELEVVK